jgi:hypothetical protein
VIAGTDHQGRRRASASDGRVDAANALGEMNVDEILARCQ